MKILRISSERIQVSLWIRQNKLRSPPGATLTRLCVERSCNVVFRSRPYTTATWIETEMNRER